MILTSTSATYGVRSTSPATSSGATGGINLGQPETQISLPTADVAWTGQVLLVDPAGVITAADIDINILAGTVTTATLWVEGNGEAETATVVGGCTTNGTLTLDVTANDVGMTAQNVTVALTTAAHGTASLVAAACRAAIAANATIAARFAVSGTGASIVLTRIGTLFKMAGGDVQVHNGINLLAFNIAIPSNALGIAADATSDNTPSVATKGVLTRDIDGKDWEGTTLPAIADGKLGVLQVTSDVTSTSTVYLASTVFGFRQMPLPPGGFVLVGAASMNSAMSSSLAITTATDEKSAFLTISVVGSSV